jgi:hypothetical protein
LLFDLALSAVKSGDFLILSRCCVVITKIYKENIVETAKTLANAAAKYKVKRFIHVSTAQVYDSGNVRNLLNFF